jgi:modulator of FtsH protease HflK
MPRNVPPPNPLEDYLRELNAKRMLRALVLVVAFLLTVAAVLTCFYTVQPEGQAVVKRFRPRQHRQSAIGLHFKLPFGIDRVYFVPTERVLKQEFGFRTAEASGGRTQLRKEPIPRASR